MTVNFEVKGMLARLLATEDIIVEHRQVETASFDVEKRVLTLPIWKAASNEVYDLLLSHEAAHALYTPTEDWSETHKIPMQYVNITEDARIEKLVKRRYAGLAKTFYSGYKELAEKDFFCLGDDDVSEYNLADRANLYFKIGTHLQLSFTPEEKDIIDLIANCETFDDTLYASKVLYEYCKKNYPQLEPINIKISTQLVQIGGDVQNGEDNGSNGDQNSSFVLEFSETSSSPEKDNNEQNSKEGKNGGGDVGDNNEQNSKEGKNGGGDVGDKSQSSNDKSQSSSGESESSNGKSGEDPGKSNEESNGDLSDVAPEQSTPGGNGVGGDPNEIKTVDRLNKSIQELIDDKKTSDYVYIETPKLNLDEVIVSNKDLEKVFNDYWGKTDPSSFQNVDKKFNEFKQTTQREVNFLVKEFESKKAADAYSRSLTSRTGVLDCTKLHTYKFNDDLFKKITTLPDGKNHGLIFILDWSGSMGNVIMDTVKQLFNLIWFCKKISIPFELYAFTTDYPGIKYDSNGNSHPRGQSYVPQTNLISIGYYFSLMNLLSSQTNSYTLNNQMKNIFRIAYAYTNHREVEYKIPPGLKLSGTPLNESLIALQEIIPEFKNKHKLQKVQCVILTDGDSCPPKYHLINVKTQTGMVISNGCNSVSTNTFLRNRKTGNIYNFSSEYWDHPRVFLENLRDMYPETNFIGFRLLNNREGQYFVRRYIIDETEYQKYMESWRTNKSLSVKDRTGYHKYFALSSNTLSQDSNFEVSDQASKIQIKNAFLRSVKTKKTNKKILTEFIDLIV